MTAEDQYRIGWRADRKRVK